MLVCNWTVDSKFLQIRDEHDFWKPLRIMDATESGEHLQDEKTEDGKDVQTI